MQATNVLEFQVADRSAATDTDWTFDEDCYEAMEVFITAAFRLHRYVKQGESWLLLNDESYLRRMNHLAKLEMQYTSAAERLLTFPFNRLPTCEDDLDKEEHFIKIQEDLEFIEAHSTLGFPHRADAATRLDNYRVIRELKRRDLRMWFCMY